MSTTQRRCLSFFNSLTLPFFLASVILLTGQGGHADSGGVFDEGSSSQDVVHASAKLSMTAVAPGDMVDAAVVASIDKGWHINSYAPYEDWLIPAKVTVDTLDGLTPTAISYPEGEDAFLAGSNMSVYEGRVVIPFRIIAAGDIEDGDHVLPVQLEYQPCNDRMCGPPATIAMELTVKIGPNGQPTNDDVFASTLASQTPTSPATSAPATTNVPEPQSDLQRLISDYGAWGYVLALGLAFLTGLVLSFSPCTYPMIPITVSIFGGQQRTVGRGFVLSLFYVTSMAVVYGIMGLVVSLVGGVFGAWLASPPVVITIAVVFVIFSLSMFGIYELNVPMSVRQKLGTRQTGGGVFGAIVLGIIAALVVSPCVGPFVAGILLYVATNGSPVLGFLVLFVFALGLGTLYVLIGTFSSAINKLPGSGGWMETVKKFFGFVLLLMALYFLRTIVSEVIIAVFTGLLLLALGIFGGGLDRLTSESPFFDRLKKFVGILALIFGIYFLGGTVLTEGLLLPPIKNWLPAGGAPGVEAQAELIPWDHNLESGLARAREENKPVLIDTWATWCANCRLMDKETYGNAQVALAAKRFVPIKVQLETADSPESIAFMKQFGLKHYSLPTTLLLSSDGQVVNVLQGFIKPEEMVDYLAKIK
jgi:thiol:disulfide interchange protein DsbD